MFLFRNQPAHSHRFIETYSKTFTNGLAIFFSVGGWFLWNILLSVSYNPFNKIYYVRGTFLHGFGATFSWWLCLLIILSSALVFELGVQSLLATYFTTDEDVFRILEKDPDVKRRLEEASATELQQGWDRKTNKERDQLLRVEETVDKVMRMEQARREKEVKTLLENRRSEGGDGVDGGEADRVLSRGFGDVRGV